MPTEIAGERFLSRDEAAAKVGKSPRTLAWWEQRRIGPPVTRFGMSPYYREKTFLEWLMNREGEAA